MLWDVWRGRVSLPERGRPQEALSYRRFVSLGMLATVTNPFWYAWWVTFAPNLIWQAQQAFGLAAVAAFYIGHISADFAWDTLLSTVVGSGRRWMTNGLYRSLVVVCAVFFVYLGVSFLLQGVGML
jgi:threonine/homoserine/homoserine lactone efflux protein